MEKQSQRRNLRSKEVIVDSSLFNFEQDPSIIDPDEVITLVDHIDGTLLSDELVLPQISLTSDIISVDEPVKRSLRRSKSADDPLNEELYSLYHRRMEKEEKKMLNRDRETFYSEADKLKSQLQALDQTDWMKALPSITYVRDLRDMDELQKKRKWTVSSINILLDKFEDWRKREDRILGRIRSHSLTPPPSGFYDFRFYTSLNKYDYIGDSDTDGEEEKLSVEQIRQRRKLKRFKKFGPVIRINFGGNCLVAQPFEETKIEKL
jgi:something-about-silencing protein 4